MRNIVLGVFFLTVLVLGVMSAIEGRPKEKRTDMAMQVEAELAEARQKELFLTLRIVCDQDFNPETRAGAIGRLTGYDDAAIPFFLVSIARDEREHLLVREAAIKGIGSTELVRFLNKIKDPMLKEAIGKIQPQK